MGKQKQQKLYKLNHKKVDSEHQEKMKNIMKDLAQSKKNNSKQVLVSITELGTMKKKIRKEEKLKKNVQKIHHQAKQAQQLQKAQKLKQNGNEQKQIHCQEYPLAQQKINIFEINQYDSGVKTVITNKIVEQVRDEQKYLESQSRRVMGQSLNLQKFGEKPLRIIEEEQVIAPLSDDQDQPNSLKNICHPNIRIPQGNLKIVRSREIQEFRQKLPIYMKEQEIVETINNNLVTLICGETGSGKSTQIGQFLLQKNYESLGQIAITQPRRLATLALASRVAQETNSKLGELIGYQIRHESSYSPQTKIKFMTDGILLNEMSSDFYLLKYSVIVIDEAHQRKVNTDILIGLLSKLVLIRYHLSLQPNSNISPLRLVIMSATMRVQDFQNQLLFQYKVPIINVQARMFPVTVYYQKNTPDDYKDAAVKKCLRIHKTLPEGDVLIFLTGKEEIHELAIMLEQALNREHYEEMEEENSEHQILGEERELKTQNQPENVHQEKHQRPSNFVVHCLYSSLPMEMQQRIFQKTDQKTRKFVISTNIAETSITIPNIRYVIDSGQQKHRYFEGVWKWHKGWGSKAMAQQRSGRAGRTTHGYCYRLYSSALYANIMEEYPLPEINKQPLESVILQLKSMGIENIYEFPFPTRPPVTKMHESLLQLIQIKALMLESETKKLQEQLSQHMENTKITELGKVLSVIPLQPKLGKILLMGRKLKVPKYCLLMVILLTVDSIFMQEFQINATIKAKPSKDEMEDGENLDDKSNRNKVKNEYMQEMRKKVQCFKSLYKGYIMEGHHGDIFTSMNIVGEFFTVLFNNLNHHKSNSSSLNSYQHRQNSSLISSKIANYSNRLTLNQHAMREIFYNADQLLEIYQTLCNQKIELAIKYQQPTPDQLQALTNILLDAYVPNVCHLVQKNVYENRKGEKVYVHQLSDVYMRPQILFMCCVEVHSNIKEKLYMKYPFPIHSYEALASYGQVLTPTDYAWRNDRIVGLTTGVLYGWEVPHLTILDLPNDIKYYFVAKFLLEGKIVKSIKSLEKYYNSPTSILKLDNISYKVQKIVEALRIKEISSKKQLIEHLKTDKNFMREELALWVDMKNYNEVFDRIRVNIIQNEETA